MKSEIYTYNVLDGGFGAPNISLFDFFNYLPDDSEQEAREAHKKKDPVAYAKYLIWEKLYIKGGDEYYNIYRRIMIMYYDKSSTSRDIENLRNKIKEDNPEFYDEYLVWEKEHLEWEKRNGIF